MSASVSTAQWSEIPGTLRDDFINPGLLVTYKGLECFCLWWVLFVAYLGQGMIIQARQKVLALPLVGG